MRRTTIHAPSTTCPEERPAGIERSGVVAVVDTASSHATASVAGVQPAVSTHPVSASGIRRSGRPLSGHLGSSSREGPALGRLLSIRPASSCLVSTRAVSSRPLSSRPTGRVRLLHAQAVASGTRSRRPATVTTGNRWGPRWLPGRRWFDRWSRGRDAGDAALGRVGQGRSGRARAAGSGAGRGGRACSLSDQPGQAGVRSACRGRLRGGYECRRQREVAVPAAWLPSSGWVRDHGGWSSPSLTPGWAAPEGPGEVPAGMGVRPQRGPGRQRTRPARCRQRCDLRRWVVGLPGLEPGTSSLSGFCHRLVSPGSHLRPARTMYRWRPGDRYEPLGSDGVWTKRGPAPARVGFPGPSGRGRPWRSGPP